MDISGIRAIQEFQKVFNCCRQSWASFILRTMLVKTKENSWKIYYGEAIFQRKRVNKTAQTYLLFESQNVKVFEAVHRVDDFEHIWSLIVGKNQVQENQLEGKIQIGDIAVEYKATPQLIDQTAPKPKITKGYMSGFFEPPPIVEGLNWPALGIDLGVENKNNYLNIDKEAIERELRTHPSIPFMSLEAVADCYMDTSPRAIQHIRKNAIFCIFAPVYFRYEEVALSQKTINFTVRVDKKLTENISIALMPTSMKRRTRKGLRLSKEEFKISGYEDADSILQASRSFNKEILYMSILSFIGKSIIPASIHLLYSEPIPNLRAKVHQYWDPQNQWLIKFLQGQGKNPQDDFEYAVSAVLHIAGYQTEHIGQLGGLLSRYRYGEIDIFAFPPGKNRIYAVECTTGPIEDKVTEVKNITARMRTQIEKCHITPVIATSLTKNEIPPDTLKEAGKKGVLVLHQNLLIEMLEKTQGDIQFVDFLENIARKSYLEYRVH